MSIDHDISIVGGGLAGTALALGLANAGFSVCIVDKLALDTRTHASFDGRSYALALASVRLLKGIGVWQDISSNAQPMLEIKVTDGRAGEGPAPWMMHFDHAEIDEGPMGHMVEDRHLRNAVMAHLDTHDRITQIPAETVITQDLKPDGITLHLESRRSIKSQLVVGADGRSSGIAERAGISRTGWDYGQTALVCAVAHEKSHNGIAHQFFMPNGPLAILPLTQNRSSIVWSESKHRANILKSLDDAAFLDELRPAFGSFLGEISLTGKRYTYPLNLTLANSMIADRIALIGDAAHGVHPIAGQGLNAGLRDVAALIDVLMDARRIGQDIGSEQILRHYQEWRRFDTATLALATDAFNRLFSNDNPLLRLARDMGMGVVNSVPALRRSFVREAAGLTGDLPSLMQG